MSGLIRKVPTCLDAHRCVGEHVADILMVDDRICTTSRVRLRPIQNVFISRPCGSHCSNTCDGSRPSERLADREIAVTQSENVFGRNASVIEMNVSVLIETLSHRVDQRFVRYTRSAARHENAR